MHCPVRTEMTDIMTDQSAWTFHSGSCSCGLQQNARNHTSAIRQSAPRGLYQEGQVCRLSTSARRQAIRRKAQLIMLQTASRARAESAESLTANFTDEKIERVVVNSERSDDGAAIMAIAPGYVSYPVSTQMCSTLDKVVHMH